MKTLKDSPEWHFLFFCSTVLYIFKNHKFNQLMAHNMRFNFDKSAFGRHESFGLRYGWLTKGFNAFQEDPSVFENEDATVILGVGKNMVKSIKNWLFSANLISREVNGICATDIGKLLFGKKGYDHYLENEGTIWLLHWLLATNAESSTVFYWFFNLFHRTEFKNDDILKSLEQFVESDLKANYSHNTLKQDIQILLRMYSHTRESGNNEHLKELDCPLSSLQLIAYYKDAKSYQSKIEKRDHIPLGIFGYALLDVFSAMNFKEIPLEKLIYNQDGYATIGSIFRLSENGFIYHVEKLMAAMPNVFEYSESSGLRQLYLLDEKISKYDLLKWHFDQ
ncbi:DUF4007 family protein [Maridesulfovibrio ferrireducens]|nr:DUF4007 family protein [Maridesulfovibrio ferrireducens]